MHNRMSITHFRPLRLHGIGSQESPKPSSTVASITGASAIFTSWFASAAILDYSTGTATTTYPRKASSTLYMTVLNWIDFDVRYLLAVNPLLACPV